VADWRPEGAALFHFAFPEFDEACSSSGNFLRDSERKVSAAAFLRPHFSNDRRLLAYFRHDLAVAKLFCEFNR
jgi:hypothetical protein